ncbi:MAG: hypothetical protein ACI3XR_03580 [Eubacteriales bacterium]
MNVTYCSACPICGHYRVRGEPNSHITYNCPKCGQLLDVLFDDLGFHVQIIVKESGVKQQRQQQQVASQTALQEG